MVVTVAHFKVKEELRISKAIELLEKEIDKQLSDRGKCIIKLKHSTLMILFKDVELVEKLLRSYSNVGWITKFERIPGTVTIILPETTNNITSRGPYR